MGDVGESQMMQSLGIITKSEWIIYGCDLYLRGEQWQSNQERAKAALQDIRDNPGHLLSMAESLGVSEFISYLLCQPERSQATYLQWPVFSKKDLMWGDVLSSQLWSTAPKKVSHKELPNFGCVHIQQKSRHLFPEVFWDISLSDSVRQLNYYLKW